MSAKKDYTEVRLTIRRQGGNILPLIIREDGTTLNIWEDIADLLSAAPKMYYEIAQTVIDLEELAREIQPANTNSSMLDDDSNLASDKKAALHLAIRLRRRARAMNSILRLARGESES